MKGKFPILTATALIGLATWVACGKPQPPKLTLRIGVYMTQDLLPYFVMQERGFDKQNGFQLAETRYEGGAAVIVAIATGLLDVGYVGTVPLLAAAEQGIVPDKVLAVAGNNSSDPDHPAAAVLAGSGINNWKDLEEKNIAVNAATSITAAAVQGRLLREGARNYRLVEIPFANMGLAMAGGNVAAASMYDPFLTQSLLRGDGKILGWVIGGPPFERMVTTVTVFSSTLRQKNPAAVKAFLRAHLQAVKWINQNPAGSRSALAKRLNLSKEVSEKLRLLSGPSDARIDMPLLESAQPFLQRVGIIKTPIPAGKFYDEALLNEALAERR